MQKVIDKIIEMLENASWWTEQTYDMDGFGNDDSEEVVHVDKAIEIVNQVAKEFADDIKLED